MPFPKLPTLSVLAASALFSSTLSSEPEAPALVIYNSNLGLVHEQRALAVDKSDRDIVYPGVATTVQTDSVNVVLPEGITLYSQQYRFDRITLQKILRAHIGKPVRYKSGPPEKRTVKKGTLVAVDPAVVQTADGIESGMAPGDFIFDAIPDTLIMKPSLVWNIAAERDIDGMMALDYLITGIRWKSDYILNLHDDNADLTGWITVDNRSGKRFEQIRLHLLAGDINRAQAPVMYDNVMRMEKAMPSPAVAHAAHEGYHLYSVPFKVTLADNEKTQIKFIDKPRHAVKRLYDVTMQNPFTTGREQKRPVNQYVELSPLDIPLPGGIVRSYSKSGDTTVLLGETRLENTPKNEKVKLRLGTNFDLIAKNRLLSSTDQSRYREVSIRYTLINRSDKTKSVDVNVPGVIEDARRRTVINTSRRYTRPDGYTVRFPVTLKAGKTASWRVTYRVPKP